VVEARAALEKTRQAIHASAARRRRQHAAADRADRPAPAGAGGDVEATCPSCGRGLRVRYRAASQGPVVAFPVACPFEECEGVAAVEYPVSAVDVAVEPARESRD